MDDDDEAGAAGATAAGGWYEDGGGLRRLEPRLPLAWVLPPTPTVEDSDMGGASSCRRVRACDSSRASGGVSIWHD